MRAFFTPAGCAIIGASRDPSKPGHQIVRSMLDAGFPPERLHPVNPRETEIAGLPVHPDLVSVPAPVELAVVVVPGRALDEVLGHIEARAKTRGDLKAVIVTSGGYAELGTAEGRARQKRLVRAARAAGVRVMGPNCIGVIDTHSRIDTTFLHGVVPRPGGISFVSQSGAVGAWFTQMLSSELEPAGFAKFISLGNMADLTMADALDFLRSDQATQAVGLYLEGTAEPRPLLRALAALAADKPVVVLKTGRSEAGREAATSHTGALAGVDRVWDGALRQAGVLRVDGMEEFVDTLRVLAARPGEGPAAVRTRRGRGPLRVFVVTHAGGPGVYTMDLVASRPGLLEPAVVSSETRRALEEAVPPFSSVCRPEGHVDMTASATPEQHAEVAGLLLRDQAVDAVITLDLATRFLTDTDVAEALAQAWRSRLAGAGPGGLLPVFLPVIMHGSWGARGRAVLERAGLPALDRPERAVAVLANLARALQLAPPGEVPGGPASAPLPAPSPGSERGDSTPGPAAPPPAPAGPGTTLNEAESAALLATTGVRLTPSVLVSTADEALQAAKTLGYPLVLKVCSRRLPHKAAAGAVRTGLGGPEDLLRAFETLRETATRLFGPEGPEGFLVQRQAEPGLEVIVGGLRDPLFGPVVAVGRGGTRVGLDSPLLFRLAPLDPAAAGRLALEAVEGAAGPVDVDTEALAEVVLGMSRLLTSRPDVAEADLNPVILYARGRGCVAVDALVRLGPPGGPGSGGDRERDHGGDPERDHNDH